MDGEARPVRLRLSKAWQWAMATSLYTWRQFLPVSVGLAALGLAQLAQAEASAGAYRAGMLFATLIIVWSLDLAYERGRAASAHESGLIIARMVAGDHQAEIVVTHEHKASPEVLAIIRAEAALAQSQEADDAQSR